MNWRKYMKHKIITILVVTLLPFVLSALFVPSLAMSGVTTVPQPQKSVCCPAHTHLRYIDHTWIDGGNLWVQYKCSFPTCTWSEDVDLGPVVGPSGATGPVGLIGPQGIPGIEGNGISSIYITETGRLVIVFTSGDNFTSEISIIGDKGDKGDTGPTGPSGAAGVGGVGAPGPAGSSGATGATGPAGISGKDGVGVKDAAINGSGHLILTFTNGETKDTGYVIGPQGAAGLKGDTGPQGTTNLQPYTLPGEKGTSSFSLWVWVIIAAGVILLTAVGSTVTYLILRRQFFIVPKK
jgi:hypothetical protein